MKTRKLVFALLVSSFTVFSTYAAGRSAPAMMADGTLAGGNGMARHTFDKDAGGKSMCNGP